MDESTPLVSNSTYKPIKKRTRLVRVVLSLLLALGVGYLIASTWNSSTIRLSYEYPLILKPLRVRVYTNNIRYDNKNLDKHERPWSKRKQLITSSIDFNTFNQDQGNVVCLQEVLHGQLKDILYNLNDENKTDFWTYYGVGRSDGKKAGEYAPILYKTLDWITVETRTFWLSETPDVPSRGWDAALERIVTMVTLQLKINPLIKLNFFNTHFDHRGIKARRESSKLIIEKMRNYNNYPSFLCGDFNTQPTDEPYHILKKLGFKDSRTLIDHLHHYGHDSTFTGFDKNDEANTIIDYIWAPYFAQNGNGLESQEELPDVNFFGFDFHLHYEIDIKNFAILQNRYQFYMSDHRPVTADFEVSIKPDF